MVFQALIEITVAILLAGFAFGAPSLNDVDLEEKEYDLKDADVYYDQSQNGTENYKINLDGVSIIWSPLSSLIAASGLLDLPFGTDQVSESEVNNFLFKANKNTANDGLKESDEENKKKTSLEILPIEIMEDGSDSANESKTSSKKEGSDMILVEESKPGKIGHKKRKFSISDFLKPFARRTIIRSKMEN